MQWTCFIYVVVTDVIICHIQSYGQCDEDAAQYGNGIQTNGGVVFEHSSMTSSRKILEGFTLKERDVTITDLSWIKST